MLGFSVEEMQQLTFLDVTHPDDVAESREAVRFHLCRRAHGLPDGKALPAPGWALRVCGREHDSASRRPWYTPLPHHQHRRHHRAKTGGSGAGRVPRRTGAAGGGAHGRVVGCQPGVGELRARGVARSALSLARHRRVEPGGDGRLRPAARRTRPQLSQDGARRNQQDGPAHRQSAGAVARDPRPDETRAGRSDGHGAELEASLRAGQPDAWWISSWLREWWPRAMRSCCAQRCRTC